MYGTQAQTKKLKDKGVFENDVKMYGTQAYIISNPPYSRFENDVKMYGTQARTTFRNVCGGLRMM